MSQRIIESDGSIFDSGCAALVSPVDAATGVQGKGLALEFKRRWPERCAGYARLCREGQVFPGDAVFDEEGDPIILFAATKRHWREKSNLEVVERCLRSIVAWTKAGSIASVAIPALGCGLGGLRWVDVRPMILDAAARMQCERVVIYGPK